MTFDRSKVIDGLCDNLEKWIGWKGYFSDRLVALKIIVEEEDGETYELTRVNVGEAYPFKITDHDWQFFYPVEPPKKPKIVPFDNCQEVIEWYCGLVGQGVTRNAHPAMWVREKENGIDFFVSGFNSMFVRVNERWINTNMLFEDYTLLDGTPIGKKEE